MRGEVYPVTFTGHVRCWEQAGIDGMSYFVCAMIGNLCLRVRGSPRTIEVECVGLVASAPP
jgi:hypothetical protein